MNRLTIIITLAVLTLAGSAGPARAQTAVPSPAATGKYQPTEVQSLKLQVAQKNAQLAQVQLQQAQANYQQAMLALQTASEEIKTENKWGKQVTFDFNNLTFNDPSAAPAPAPAPSKTEPAPEVKK